MKYTFEKAEKSTVKVTIELGSAEWKEANEQAYQKTKGRYSMPGFRKGKVPKKVLESAYGVGLFYEDAINYAFPKYFGEILDKEPSIKAIAQPDLDIKDISPDAITMIAIVPVKPEVKVGAYKGLTFKKNTYRVKVDDIKEELTRLQERNSRMVEVDREVEDGDTVTINYSGSVDGVKFEGGTAENQTLVIGSKTFIPGFEEQIIGMKKEEEKDISVKFPEEYHAENLKGKDAIFAIKLLKIEKKELPELNDEFIKDAVGAESLDAYKDDIRERLKKQNADRAQRELEDEIVKKITETTEVEIPDAMIESQIDSMVQEMSYRLSYQGLKLEDYLKYMGKSMEEYRGEFKEQATDIVKSQLAIEKIIEEEKFEATEADVEARVNEMAEAQGKKAPDVKKNINARQLDYIKNEIIIKKLFEFLKKENTIE